MSTITIYSIQSIKERPSCGVPTTAFWNCARRSIVAKQFCGCLTVFLRFVRLSLSQRASVLRSLEHLSVGHGTACTSAVPPSYSYPAFLISAISGCDWPLSGNRMTKYLRSGVKKVLSRFVFWLQRNIAAECQDNLIAIIHVILKLLYINIYKHLKIMSI